jgi:hypothetical protein
VAADNESLMNAVPELVMNDDAAPQAGSQDPEEGRIVDVRGEWWDGDGHIFLTWGLLNPNGPTLYLLGSRQFAGKHRIFVRWLHMLGGTTTYGANSSDTIDFQWIMDEAVAIRAHLAEQDGAGLFNIPPNFVIASHGNKALDYIAKYLILNGAAAQANWGREMAYVRQYGADFFGIAGAQLREMCEIQVAQAKAEGRDPADALEMIETATTHLPQFRDGKIPRWEDSPLTEAVYDAWWDIISRNEYQITSLQTLRNMWEGASSMLTGKVRARLVDWKPVQQLLQDYKLALPG